MATQPYIQTSFNAGELSPRLFGRIDVDKYYSGCKTMENAIAQKWGPATRRPGTKYAGNAISTRTSQFANRLIPFQYNTEQSYVLALESDASGNLIRFFKDEGVFAVTDPGETITNGTFDSDVIGWTNDSGTIAWDNGNDGVSPNGGFAEFGGGESAYQDVSSWPADTNSYAIRFRVMATMVSVEPDIYDAAMTLTISTNSGSTVLRQVEVGIGTHVVGWTHNSETTVRFHFENSGASTVIGLDDVVICDSGALEIQHPWDGNDECRKIGFTQSADVLFLGHSSFRPQRLLRLADNVWSLEPYPHENGPWFPDNTSTVTMNPAAASGNGIVITASADTFVDEDLGRLIAIKMASDWGWAVIVRVTNATTVRVNIQSDFDSSASGVTTWKLGMWGTQGDRSDYPHNPEPSWPWQPTFHAQRLWWGGSDTKPRTVWGSVVGDFYDFSPYAADETVGGDDSINRDIDGDQNNAVRWLKSVSRGLLIGTSGGEFVGNGGDPSDAITPTSFDIKRQSTYGSKEYVEALLVGQSVIFAQATGRKIRQARYSFERDQYVSSDLTRLAEHITSAFTEVEISENVVSLAYQQEPNSALWAVRADGQLLHLTLEQDEDVYAWSRIIVAGPTTTGILPKVDGTVESATVTRYEGRDQVWIAVRRRIDSSTVCHVEVFQPEFGPEHGLTYANTPGGTTTTPAAWFLDAAVAKYDASPFTSVSGLDHLEGETVTAIVNEASDSSVQIVTGLTVSSGSVTVPSSTSAVVGKPYDTTVETMPILPGREAALLFGKHRINRAYVQVDRSSGVKVQPIDGDEEDLNLGQIELSGGLGVYTVGEGLFTGAHDTPVSGRTDSERELTVKVTQDEPLPLTLLALRVEVDVGGI